MKSILFAAVSALFIISCGEKKEEAPKTLCENPCVSDTLTFTAQHPLEPKVRVIPGNCLADSVVWSHKKMESNRKIHLSTFMNGILSLDNNTIRGYVKDTSYAFLVFNDCSTRRGYWLKLYFNKTGLEQSFSAINSIDPRYKLEEGLICYKAENTVYVEEMMTGKKATVEVPAPVLEYARMYDIIDSVNVTRTRIFMNLKDGDKMVPFEKNITLE